MFLNKKTLKDCQWFFALLWFFAPPMVVCTNNRFLHHEWFFAPWMVLCTMNGSWQPKNLTFTIKKLFVQNKTLHQFDQPFSCIKMSHVNLPIFPNVYMSSTISTFNNKIQLKDKLITAKGKEWFVLKGIKNVNGIQQLHLSASVSNWLFWSIFKMNGPERVKKSALVRTFVFNMKVLWIG